MSSFTSYEAAELNYTKKEIIFSELWFLYSILKAILLSIPEFFKWLIPKKSKSIKGQLALVTGGSNGIGRAIAMSLAEKGCNIAIANRNHQEGMRTAKEIEEKFGVKAKAFKVDVSKSEEIIKLKIEIESSLGCVDILVNNAAFLALKFSLLEGTDQDIQQCIDTNLTAYFWTVRAFLPGMIERKHGHIVAVSSIIAFTSLSNCLAYKTTKGGNDHFMNALYDDLCWQGHDDYIKLTTIFPGGVATQKSFQKLSDGMLGLPLHEPSYVGRMTVAGLLQNRRKIYIPASILLMSILNWLPDRTMKNMKLSLSKSFDVDHLKKIRDSL